jgi:hypothetical protein
MNRRETQDFVYGLLERLNARRLFITDGPNEMSEFEGWVVGDRIVIIQLWKDGGADHYIQSATAKWEGMERELTALVEERKQRTLTGKD